MTVSDNVYLNGEIVKQADARLSIFDRASLFAHAAYEVTAVYNGKLVDFAGHMARLERTLAELQLPNPKTHDQWHAVHMQLLEANKLTEGLIYLQVTGGDYGFRDFSGPDTFAPNVILFCTPRALIGAPARDGISAITVEDTRWSRRDLKTTQLLSQALAYREARHAGATTAIMHEEGYVTEAASANVWIVDALGKLTTRALSSDILAGITREALIKACRTLDIEIQEISTRVDELSASQEVFTSSAGALIAPVTHIDGAPIGTGRPGPVTRQIQQIYYARMGADLSLISWL